MDQVGTSMSDVEMYGEDLDWCYRFSQLGWRVVYWPGAAVTHVKAGITGRRRVRINFAFPQCDVDLLQDPITAAPRRGRQRNSVARHLG